MGQGSSFTAGVSGIKLAQECDHFFDQVGIGVTGAVGVLMNEIEGIVNGQSEFNGPAEFGLNFYDSFFVPFVLGAIISGEGPPARPTSRSGRPTHLGVRAGINSLVVSILFILFWQKLAKLSTRSLSI